MKDTNRFFGAVCLIAGTTIGAGMLAMPIATGIAGWIPSSLLIIFFWFYMTATAFLLLEVNLRVKAAHTNLISLARATLGWTGELAAWIAYLFLLYTLATAYLAGSHALLNDLSVAAFGQKAGIFALIPFFVLFAWALYQGVAACDRLNRVLSLGLIFFYVALVLRASGYLEWGNLTLINWSDFGIGTPIVLTAFGFHIVIPTLVHYLKRDTDALKKAIFVGSLIPLVIYLIWQTISLSVLSPSEIATAKNAGVHAATLIGQKLHSSEITFFAIGFSLFAIATSFLGVTLSLFDFLADGLQIPRTGHVGKAVLFVMTLAPPCFFALADPKAFFSALEIAGVFGVAFLLCLLPVLMVWKSRKSADGDTGYRAPISTNGLIFIGFVALFFIFNDLYHYFI